MQYHLKEYFAAYPNFISHRVFRTWDDVVKEFGEELSKLNYGEMGENCPSTNDGVEFDSSTKGMVRNDGVEFDSSTKGMVRDDGVQEFYVTDDEGKPFLQSFVITVDYVTSRTATFHIDAETQLRAEELVIEACGNHDFSQHTHNCPETKITDVEVLGPSNEYFNPILVPREVFK